MKRKIPETITEEELIKIVKATKKKKHRLAFMLGFYQAMRVSEVVNLTTEDVDYNRRLLLIKNAKGGKDRNIPIAPQIFRGLKHLPIKVGIRALQKSFKNKVNRLKLDPRLHFHSLRHGFATRAIERGIPLNQVQLSLGHSSVKTTSIYIQANPKDMLKSFEEKF